LIFSARSAAGDLIKVTTTVAAILIEKSIFDFKIKFTAWLLLHSGG